MENPISIEQSLQIAWAAGLFEGEGCITLSEPIDKRNGMQHSYIALELRMTDKDVVDRFHEVVGYIGNMHYAKGQTVKHKGVWGWRCTRRADCIKVILMFWPYLGERRKARAIEIHLIREKDGIAS
jgi:hypothetical protein